MNVLVAIAILCADFAADPDILRAGVEGYRQRAGACRPEAIKHAEHRAKELGDSLADARRGRILEALVGSPDAAGIDRGGKTYFGTQADKDARIKWLTDARDAWREHAVGLRSRMLLPQVAFDFNNASPGAAGIPRFAMPVQRTLNARTAEFVLAGYSLVWDGERPRLVSTGDRIELTIIVHHSGELELNPGDRIPWRHVYQFSGVRGDKPEFHRVYDINVGPTVMLFSRDGLMIQSD